MNDKEFLQWVHDRMSHVYGENESFDFMYKLRAIIAATPEAQVTPNVV